MVIKNAIAIANGSTVRSGTFDIGPLCAELGDSLGLFPELVFYAGNPGLFSAPSRIAIAGSRHASPQGLQNARRLAATVARHGGLVLSGLARGIDRAAHEGALEAGGRTAAVIATPLDACYPPEHGPLQALLAREHLVISPFEAGRIAAGHEHEVQPAAFLARNQLMARLCHAAVVIEARPRSGSLAFARASLALGRPLFLLPSVLEQADTEARALLQRGAQLLVRPSTIADLFTANRR